jgi:uncharacterized repeat protein (TIGR03803 family)
MNTRLIFPPRFPELLILTCWLGLAAFASAQTTILYSFKGPSNNDGEQPEAPLVLGPSGYFYGTTFGGGSNGDATGSSGTIFRINSTGSSYSVLHSFVGGTMDGGSPLGPLAGDGNGNLYGTTLDAGFYNAGTLFLYNPSTGVSIVHNFGESSIDGLEPEGNLLLAAADGNLYGTTSDGNSGEGTVYRLTKSSNYTQVQIVYTFGLTTGDGAQPHAGLTQGSDQNLYGTTSHGGTFNQNCGTVFKVNVTGAAPGAIPATTIIHSFNFMPNDGYDPEAGLTLGSDGNLYGTTESGGTINSTTNDGTVFQITNTGSEKVIHSFSGIPDGQAPRAGLILVGNTLYGTTAAGGSVNHGTIFSITLQGAVTILHNFLDGTVANDGSSPLAGLVVGTDGNLYGTASGSGASGFGAIYKYTFPVVETDTPVMPFGVLVALAALLCACAVVLLPRKATGAHS